MSNATKPETPARQALLDDVKAAVRAQDHPRAIQLARMALDGGFEHPLFYNLRAYWFEGQENLRAAQFDLERARELSPDDHTVLNALGLCLLRQEQFGEALEAFAGAVAIKPDFAEAHFSKGSASESLNDRGGAELSYRKAVEIKTDFVEPLSRLAHLAALRHDWGQVQEFAVRALALDQGNVLALVSLANGALERGDFEEAEALLTRAMHSPSGEPVDKSVAKSLLGDLRHEQKRYSEAFNLFTEANQERRALFATRLDASLSRTGAYDYAVWLRRYFETAPAALWAASDANVSRVDGGAARHVFLVGFPRSGTTLLEQALAGHPDVVTSEETEGLRGIIGKCMADARGRDRLAALSGQVLDEYRAQYWAVFEQLGINVQGKAFIDKHPLSTQMLPLISKLFPQAKILFAIRDPRDVVLGCFRRPFKINAAMFEFLTMSGTARYYDAVMGIGEISRRKLGLQWHDIRHEALVDDFDSELAKVVDFIGLEWNDAMRDFAQRARVRATRTPSAVQLARGLNRRGVGQWRNYADAMAPVLPSLRPWVGRFNYAPE